MYAPGNSTVMDASAERVRRAWGRAAADAADGCAEHGRFPFVGSTEAFLAEKRESGGRAVLPAG